MKFIGEALGGGMGLQWQTGNLSASAGSAVTQVAKLFEKRRGAAGRKKVLVRNHQAAKERT